MIDINNLYWGLGGIAFTFFVHYFFVTVVLGLSVIIPIFEIKGRISKDDDYIKFARRLTSYLIRVDLFAGVMATWLTVFLAGYWPSLLYIATNVLFYPIVLAIAGIMIAIVSMGLYWYTWDKMGAKAHITVGLFMVIGALLVPFGMSSIFATIDFPYGITTESVSGLTLFVPNGQNPFGNPIYIPLALYTWFISIALTSFIVLSYSWMKGRNKGPSEFNKAFSVSRLMTIIFSILSVITFFITLSELKINSQYLYSQMSSHSYLQVSEILIFLMLIFSILPLIKSIGYWIAFIGSGVSYFFMMFFEISVNIARYPYIIVAGNEGIPASDMINPLFQIPDLLPYFALITFFLMFITFLATLYLAFIRFPVKENNEKYY
ncbi:MAG: cytochrome ubiquinol oxidase subunit I [Thermoplasmata archaeon]